MGNKKSKPKNPAALTLAAISRKKRMKTMTPEQRSEQGRKAVAARRDRQKPLEPEPQRFWGLFDAYDASAPGGVSRDPKLLQWSTDKNELRARVMQERDGIGIPEIEELDYDPRHVKLESNFKPDVTRQLDALRVLAGTGAKR